MRGSRHPVSPSLEPVGSAGSTGCRRTSYLSTVLFGRSLRHRIYGYVGAALCFRFELDASINECEQRVILADSDVVAGMPLGPALAHKDIAGEAELPAVQFHAEAAARRAAAVALCSSCSLVSHGSFFFFSSLHDSDDEIISKIVRAAARRERSGAATFFRARFRPLTRLLPPPAGRLPAPPPARLPPSCGASSAWLPPCRAASAFARQRGSR